MKSLTGLDDQEELRRQHAILDVATAKFTRVLEREVRRAMLDMISEVERSNGAPPASPIEFDRRLSDTFQDMAVVMIQAFGNRILDQGKASGLLLEHKSFAEFFQRLALEYVSQEAIRRRIVQITETTRNLIIAGVDRGQREGLGVNQIARNLRGDVPTLSRARARTIARTETHGAANHGANGAAMATGLPLKKRWSSTEDHRTRDFGEGDGEPDKFNHRVMHGVVVDKDQPFNVPMRGGGTEPMMMPGDPNGSAANTINCRCGVGYFLDDGL